MCDTKVGIDKGGDCTKYMLQLLDKRDPLIFHMHEVQQETVPDQHIEIDPVHLDEHKHDVPNEDTHPDQEMEDIEPVIGVEKQPASVHEPTHSVHKISEKKFLDHCKASGVNRTLILALEPTSQENAHNVNKVLEQLDLTILEALFPNSRLAVVVDIKMSLMLLSLMAGGTYGCPYCLFSRWPNTAIQT